NDMQYLYSAASELSTNAAPRSSKRHATGSEGGPVMGTHRIESWPSAAATMAPELQKEFAAHAGDGRVGNELLSETDRVRVWAIGLKPGQRLDSQGQFLARPAESLWRQNSVSKVAVCHVSTAPDFECGGSRGAIPLSCEARGS